MFPPEGVIFRSERQSNLSGRAMEVECKLVCVGCLEAALPCRALCTSIAQSLLTIYACAARRRRVLLRPPQPSGGDDDNTQPRYLLLCGTCKHPDIARAYYQYMSANMPLAEVKIRSAAVAGVVQY